MSTQEKETSLPDNYRPSEKEEYMGERQRQYFKNKLLLWKQEILAASQQTLDELRKLSLNMPDITDRASTETDHAVEMRNRDRQRKLIGKIDAALQRIDDGSYGFCEETGEPIGIKRLDARPIATLSIEAQEIYEKNERMYR